MIDIKAMCISVLVVWGMTLGAYSGEKKMSPHADDFLDKMLSMEEEPVDDLPKLVPLTPDLTLPKEPPKKAISKRIIQSEEDFLDEMLSVQEEVKKKHKDVVEDTVPIKTEEVREAVVTEEVESKKTEDKIELSPNMADEAAELKEEKIHKEAIVETGASEADAKITLQDIPTQSDTQQKTKVQTIQDEGFPPGRGSLMYSDQDYQKLRKAIIAYELKHRGRVIRSGNSLDRDVPLPENAPAFFLNSLLYLSDDDWTVWLNHIKYTKNVPIEGVEITKVSRDSVHFVWKTAFADYMSPGWKRRFKITKTGEYISPDNAIRVNIPEKKVYFILQPNQTFETHLMRISEGIKRGKLLTPTSSTLAN